MSYILDALKKSEAERQQQQAPGFANTPGRSRKRRAPVWIWLLGVLLLVNVAVLAALLLRPDSGPGSASIAVPAGRAATRGTSPSFSEIVRDARQRTPVQETVAATPAPAGPANGNSPSKAATVAATPEPAATPVQSSRSRNAALPSYLELSANGEWQLPPLHLDIHVYSDTPADRFVFVNMNKYRENERLAEGPRVVEIRSDGVVLERNGSSFLLPRE